MSYLSNKIPVLCTMLAIWALPGCSDNDVVAYQPANRLKHDPLIVRENQVQPAVVDKYYAYRNHYYYFHPTEERYVQMNGKPPSGASVDHVLRLPPPPVSNEPQLAGQRQESSKW